MKGCGSVEEQFETLDLHKTSSTINTDRAPVELQLPNNYKAVSYEVQ